MIIQRITGNKQTETPRGVIPRITGKDAKPVTPVTAPVTPTAPQLPQMPAFQPTSLGVGTNQPVAPAGSALSPEATKFIASKIEPVQKEMERLETKQGTLEKQDWRDKVYAVYDNPEDLAPFVNDAKAVVQVTKLLKAADNLQKGTITKEEAEELMAYYDQQNRDSTFGYKVLDVVSKAIPFAAELFLTKGVYTFGKAATTKGLRYLSTKAGKELAENAFKKFGLRLATGVAGRTLQTIPAGITNITANTLKRQLDSAMTSSNVEDRESWGKSVAISGLDRWVENLSEFSGGVIDEVGKTALKKIAASPAGKEIIGKLVATSLYTTLKKINPPKMLPAIQSLFTDVGYNGVINEMLEERIGEATRGFLNKFGLSDQEWKLPTKEQLAVEFVAFAIPGVTAQTISSLAGGANRPEIEPSVVQVVNQKTGEKTFYTVPKGQLEEVKTRIDNTKTGIAGETINDQNWHITAKTPEAMVKAGFKEGGTVDLATIPTTQVKTKAVVTPKGTVVKQKEVEITKPPEMPRELDNAIQRSKANTLSKEEFVKQFEAKPNKNVEMFLKSTGLDASKFYDQYLSKDITRIKQLEDTLKVFRNTGVDLNQPEAYNKVYKEWKQLKYQPKVAEKEKPTSPEALGLKKKGKVVSKQVGKQAQKPVTKKKAEVRRIEDYIDKKNVKFRLPATGGNVDVAILSKKRGITTKFLEHPEIKNRKMGDWEYLNKLIDAGSLSLKQNEKDVLHRVLEVNFAENKTNKQKIDMERFKEAVVDNLMAIDVIKSDTYSDYGASGIEMSDSDTKTYILNSPWEHGRTGHFGGDFERSIKTEEVEIKEIPPQEGNPTAKFAVVRKGVTLTEENIEENVFQLAETKEKAQKWIDSHTREGVEFKPVIYLRPKGLFAHFRTFDNEDGSHVAELQSDVFQDGRIKEMGVTGEINKRENAIKLAEESVGYYKTEIEKEKENIKKAKEDLKIPDQNEYRIGLINGDIRMAENRLAEAKERLLSAEMTLEGRKKEPEITTPVPANEKLFMGYKNTWFERAIREAVNIKALEGKKVLRFATPRTVAFVEMYTSSNEDGDYCPYTDADGVNFEPEADDLNPGDQIDYGGESMTVVWAEGELIKVAPSTAVNHFDADDAMREDIDSRWEDVKYEFEKLEEDWGKIDTPEKAQKVIDDADIINRLVLFNTKEQAAKDRQQRYDESDKINETKGELKKAEGILSEWKNLDKFIREGGIAKEKLNMDNLSQQPFRDILQDRYNIASYYWEKFRNAYSWAGSATADRLNITKKLALEVTDKFIKESELDVKNTNAILINNKLELDEDLKKINARTKPTEKEIKSVSKKALKNAKDNVWGFGLGEAEWALGEMANWSQETVTIDDLYDDFYTDQAENYDPDFEGIYGEDHYFTEEKGYNNYEVWTVDEGAVVEQFGQPRTYDEQKPNDVEDFDINNFSGEQKTVLNFYEQQVIPYFKKLRKDARLVMDDNGFQWWETDLTDEDKNPPTAYRIKTDLEKVGIKITNKQEKEIIKLNNKFFGDTSIKVTEQILTNSKALGAYRKGIIQILAGQVNPKDTFYHEVVHKYMDIFLDRREHIALLEEASKIYKMKDLSLVEEKLAEDFIKYAKKREGVVGQIRRFFDTISKRIKIYLKQYTKIEALYDDIISGQAKTVSVQRRQLPVGEGEAKITRLEARVKKVLDVADEELIDQLGLTKFNQMNNKETIAAASKYIVENPEEAMKVLLGEVEAPKGLPVNAIYVAMVNSAADNMELATKLASLSSTRFGQEIEILKEIDRDSPVKIISDLIKIREAIVQKRYGKPINQIKAKEIKAIKEKVKTPGANSWEKFIMSIECK